MARKRSRVEEKAMFGRIGNHNTKFITSGEMGLKSPTKSVLEQVRQDHLDAQGRFTHSNFRLPNTPQEKIALTEIKVFNPKNKTFILKGIASDNKEIAKIVSLPS